MCRPSGRTARWNRSPGGTRRFTGNDRLLRSAIPCQFDPIRPESRPAGPSCADGGPGKGLTGAGPSGVQLTDTPRSVTRWRYSRPSRCFTGNIRVIQRPSKIGPAGHHSLLLNTIVALDDLLDHHGSLTLAPVADDGFRLPVHGYRTRVIRRPGPGPSRRSARRLNPPWDPNLRGAHPVAGRERRSRDRVLLRSCAASIDGEGPGRAGSRLDPCPLTGGRPLLRRHRPAAWELNPLPPGALSTKRSGRLTGPGQGRRGSTSHVVPAALRTHFIITKRPPEPIRRHLTPDGGPSQSAHVFPSVDTPGLDHPRPHRPIGWYSRFATYACRDNRRRLLAPVAPRCTDSAQLPGHARDVYRRPVGRH